MDVAGRATFRGLALREDGGRMNRSTLMGFEGDLGFAMLLGDPPAERSESLCWFLANVGTNSGPSSNDRKREDNRDSNSSTRNVGEER